MGHKPCERCNRQAYDCKCDLDKCVGCNAALAEEELLLGREKCVECYLGFKPVELHACELAAFEGTWEVHGYDISCLDDDSYQQVVVAAFDALPDGMDASKEAAADMLVSVLVAARIELCDLDMGD